MQGKKLLAAFLLGVGLCFVPVLGHGKVQKYVAQINMDVDLLDIRICYMMGYPTSFLYFDLHYDPHGQIGRLWLKLPQGLNTKDKICVVVRDNRGIFSNKPRIALLEEFNKTLESIWFYLRAIATDMDTDVVAKFISAEEIPLGYFYQGEYHLWEK